MLKERLSGANIGILLTLIQAFLRNKSKITVRSLFRYNGVYSLRQLFRFFGKVHPWIEISVSVLKAFLYQEGKRYLIAIDETVIEKSGKHTYGKYRFYSSIYQQVVSGICLMGLSVIEVEQGKSYHIAQEQVLVSEEDKVKRKKEKEKKRSLKGNGKRGRPKGSKNKVKVEQDSPVCRTFKVLLEKTFAVLSVIIPQLELSYAVVDSAYTAVEYVQTLQQYGLSIISKLSADAVLYLPAKPEKKRGRPAKYGQKIKLTDIQDTFLVQTMERQTYTEYIYQVKGYQKSSLKNYLLNVVVVKRIFNNAKVQTAIFFSTDLNLNPSDMIRYYALRFQIEFDFRDAKQHFGLNDFKNYKPNTLKNFVSLSFFMTLYAKILLQDYQKKMDCHRIGINDMKTLYHAHFQYAHLLKYISKPPEDISLFLNNTPIIPPDMIHIR